MTTTYGYVSLVRATIDNPEWGDAEGDLSVVAGKVPEVWMPNVPADREDMAVVGRRYEREALVKLPTRMTGDDAFEYARDEQPGELADFYAQEGDSE